jgi:DNA-binding PucR family transcriptional regulator
MTCLTTRRDDSLVALATRSDVWCDARGWKQLHTSIALELRSGRGAIGVGGHADRPRQFSRSYRQALRALQVRMSLPTPHGITVFDELGVYRWLTGPGSSLEIAALIGEWLGPLLDYDSRRGTDLVATLSAFLEHGGNYDGTAGALHIHRSTLRYRLYRIRDLTGHDLADPETRLHVEVAIRAWRIQYDG